MKIFLDPWDSEYTGFFQVEEEPQVKNVELDIELPEEKWRPIGGKDSRSFEESIFIDGVRRMHQRVVIEKNGRIFYGGFGTYAAGALKLARGVVNELSSSILAVSVKRVLIIPEDVRISLKTIDLSGLPFPIEVKYIKENEPHAPLKKLQDLMRVEEVKLSEEVLSLPQYENIPLVVDGTLYFPWKNAKVLGFVKSLHKLYLPDRLFSVIAQLKEKERTPVFSISFHDKELSRKYSWFVRLKSLDEGEFLYSGIVRIEAPGTVKEEDLYFLAMWSTSLSELVSDRMRDKRSPQNLLPVGVLEKELKKRIGNEYLIVRRFRLLLREENF